MTAVRNLSEKHTRQEFSSTGGQIIYGPFEQGPLGKVLGINLLNSNEKICSFNCPYCDLGETKIRLNHLKNGENFPSLGQVDSALTEAFRKIHASGPAVDAIVISGNGEPTMHPEFPELIQKIITARDLFLPAKPIHLFTNGAYLDKRKLADAANLLDARHVKLDAGSEKIFKVVNAPLSRTNLARVLSAIRRLKDVSLQSLFFSGPRGNIGNTDVEEWIELVAMIKPKQVYIYGPIRKPAQDDIGICDEDTLYTIASRLERKTQIKAIVTP